MVYRNINCYWKSFTKQISDSLKTIIVMKKVITFTLLISSLFLIFSCQKENNSRTSPELTQIFNEQEIKDIKILVNYFEEEIQELNSNIDSAYVDFIRSYEDLVLSKKMKFDYDKLLTVFDTIDKNTFDEIWQFNKSVYHRQSNDTLKSIGIAYEKKYHNYLDLLGKKNEKYKEYAKHTSFSGDFPEYPVLLYLLIDLETISGKEVLIYKNFNDFNRRVVLAMSVIKSIDEENRCEKWYK